MEGAKNFSRLKWSSRLSIGHLSNNSCTCMLLYINYCTWVLSHPPHSMLICKEGIGRDRTMRKHARLIMLCNLQYIRVIPRESLAAVSKISMCGICGGAKAYLSILATSYRSHLPLKKKTITQAKLLTHKSRWLHYKNTIKPGKILKRTPSLWFW